MRHAHDEMLARRVSARGRNASLDIMTAKLADNLTSAELKRILRDWATARGMTKASDKRILDAFVAYARQDAGAMSRKMNTTALSKRIVNPDAT